MWITQTCVAYGTLLWPLIGEIRQAIARLRLRILRVALLLTKYHEVQINWLLGP
jgi:hypothetical protein